MRGILAGHRAPHPKPKAVTRENKRNVVKRMVITLAQFVCPNNQGVIKHRSFLSGFRSGFEFFKKVSELFCEPGIDPDELFVSVLVLVGLV